MSETSSIVLSLFVGTSLGIVFFGGLWWTVRRGLSSESPALLFVGSLFLRTMITLAGFYFVSRGDWLRLMACLFGFVLARILTSRLTRIPIVRKTQVLEEAGL
jgi:F1F0 ATPase subunit 2